MIDRLALRVGNEKDTEEAADTVGACSLRVEHITLKDEGGKKMVTFDFLGKDSIRYFNTVEVQKDVYQNLKRFCQGRKKTDMIFSIDPSQVNNYLSSFLSGLSAKVFRTYNASFTLQQELEKFTDKLAERNGFMSDQEILQFYTDANRQVAILCNHQKSVAKGHDDQVQKMKDKLDEQSQLVKQAQRELRQEQKGTNDRARVASLTTKLEKAKAAVKKQETALTMKEENKSVALGTSKMNYMDPRISVAFCKRAGLEIHKVFSKTHLEKFPWAMYSLSTWRF
jgi:DNA topoisomerase-1